MKKTISVKFELHECDADTINKITAKVGITIDDLVMIATKRYLKAVRT